jgi:signal transduction histidine kinase
MTTLRGLEDRVIERNGNGPLPVSTAAWRAAVDPVVSELRDLERELTTSTVALAGQARAGVLMRLGLAGGLGLIAVIASIIISITTARSLTRQLERLRTAALDLARHRLPRVVERIRLGERVDVAAEAPPLPGGTDEIGMVADAFNTVQRTAIEVAVEQAELRRGVRDVFLNLARRTQALVHRQLTVLDGMERRVTNPEDLADLFRVDHLATRMRRNAENLIVLSGAMPGRGWRHPVPVVDVIRGATAEVEDYSRVTVLPIGSAGLVGRAVGDVIHLLAELIENATSFSPPETVVQVSAQMTAKGYAIEVEDRGLGMIEEDLAAANEQVVNPPEFNLSSTARLGLYVVGRLASRHGIRVSLRESPYGGTTAIVLIPAHLVVGLPEPEPADSPGGRSPEQLRAMMSSFQRGTRRGRSSTAEDDSTDPDE